MLSFLHACSAAIVSYDGSLVSLEDYSNRGNLARSNTTIIADYIVPGENIGVGNFAANGSSVIFFEVNQTA